MTTKPARKRRRARLRLWARVWRRHPWLHWREIEIFHGAKIALSGEVGTIEGVRFIERGVVVGA